VSDAPGDYISVLTGGLRRLAGGGAVDAKYVVRAADGGDPDYGGTASLPPAADVRMGVTYGVLGALRTGLARFVVHGTSTVRGLIRAITGSVE
jgi:hypothetical protein